MPIIKQMDKKLANMIAAGEVVDRPASIVKELVENAIDAQATSIKVDVTDMGMQSIIVTDNGIGMDFQDAHLAFSRHATSKIEYESDLAHIMTLGFRGEALAAISAVSKVTLKTRQKGHEGFFVMVQGGIFEKEGPASLNEGTVVEVRDLFYNTPARFKYIKSDLAEKNAIIDVFDRLALANPGIRMTLVMDGKVMKETYGNYDFQSTIAQVYGSKITHDLTYFSDHFQKIKITGYLVSPQIDRSRKKDISIFINGRYIKNFALIQAVIDGYHSFLMMNRYPIAWIHLEMDPSLLDVNVHPQKLEVKFVNESLLAYQIEHHVAQALNEKNHTIPEKHKHNQKETQSEIYRHQTLDFKTMLGEEQEPWVKMDFQSSGKIPDFDLIGVFSGTYLLFQNEQGLYLMDQHAAAERIRYEHYFASLANPNKTTKTLMIALDLNLTEEDKRVIKAYQKLFEGYGFHFNEHQQLIELPVWLKDDEIDLAIETMVSMISQKQIIKLDLLRDALAKDISCKGAIKANKALNKTEIEALVGKLRACQNPYTCPHGRPTIIKLSHHDIEKMFKRVL
ncbi:MAG: DNA mismatch repair endonuclease MutL [Acholeplasmataceae bacterium]|nr:DNA mismatch repair endonuclease MutL [Acholeplasmataceae bacterium]